MRRALAAALLSGVLGALGCGGGGDGGHGAPDGGDALGGSDGGGGDAPEAGDGTAIVVDTPPGMVATGKQDGRCDLLEAAAAAATGYSVNDCANPKGVARIVLQPGQTYVLPRTLHLSGATEIGIPDGATGVATISATPGFAVDPGDPATACLISAADAKGKVRLSDVELTQDPSLPLSGACLALGELDLRRAHVTGFHASGVVATCLPTSGCNHGADTEQAATLRVMNSLIDRNQSAGNGAGIASEGPGATVFVAHSAIVNNVSDQDGGGLYLGGGWSTDIIDSCTISGNSAGGVGGGVLVRFAEMTLTYLTVQTSTIANNTATGTGGGIEFEPAQVGMQDLQVFGSIVAGNFSSSTLEWNINAAWSPSGTFDCNNGSLIYVVPGNPLPANMGSCTFDVRNPFLGPLTPLGGEGDLPLHPLLTGSPAVDAAPGLATPDDQRDAWIMGIDPDTPSDWTVFDPTVDGDGDGTATRDLGAYERNDRWQTELLAVRTRGLSPLTVVTIPAGYDRGAGTAYAATGAVNEFVAFVLPIAEPGFYDLTVGVRRDADAGKFQLAIADNPVGPWTPIGPEQDGYGSSSGFVSLGPFASPLFATPGERLLRFAVTGKNSASAGYRLYLDFIEAKRRSAACPVATLAAGGSETCAIVSGGGLRCWGAGGSGQLGDGSMNDRAAPPIGDLVSDAAAVAVGAAHTCVLATDGGVRCWGSGDNGRLGNGSTAGRATPPPDPAISGVKAIAAGSGHTCALTLAGGVRCWGSNDHGQLGDGTMNDRSTPSFDVLTGVAAIAAGGNHTCALTTTGGVRCWGANGSGQLGDGTTIDRSTPPATDVATGIGAVSAGDTHTCALTIGGGVRCWGHNNDGELGIGSYDPVLAPPATDVLTGVAQVISGNLFTCARLTTGSVRCWGDNSHGEIGDDTDIAVDRLTPQAADILGGVASLAAGLTHVCALMTGGGVRCWGGNEAGQLGDGMTPIFALTPPPMDIPGFTGTCP